MRLGGTGIWSSELRYGGGGNTGGEAADRSIRDAAHELEFLGYSAVWTPDVGGDVFGALQRLLDATSTIAVATGILNIWKHDAADVAGFRARLSEAQRSRLLLGLGVSHRALIGDDWVKPLDVMSRYLDALDAEGVPASDRCLAALGPRMLELAAARTAGAHPYLITPEHTSQARAVLGPRALLAPEQGVVFETDPRQARTIARQALSVYATLPNYTNNWKRLGLSDEDVAELSDRLVDRLVAWGDSDAIAARVREHRDAGADHVCVQVLSSPGAPMPRSTWRELAPALIPPASTQGQRGSA